MLAVRKHSFSAMGFFEKDNVVEAASAHMLTMSTLRTTLEAGQASAGVVTAIPEKSMPNRSTNRGSNRVALRVVVGRGKSRHTPRRSVCGLYNNWALIQKVP